VRREACLGWWDEPREPDDHAGELEPDRHFALLLDISHMGASVAVDSLPHQGQEVWMKVEDGRPSQWIEAEVVGIRETLRGPHVVRMAFLEPCPIETLLKTLCD
jgi:hypothetical protein